MTPQDAVKFLEKAREHLKRVEVAWDDPVDWLDLSIYGFYCLEAAVVAAAIHAGIRFTRSHRGKTEAAKKIADLHGLRDVSDLLYDLNSARKASAYGDVDFPDLDPEDVAEAVEHYVDEVAEFLQI